MQEKMKYKILCGVEFRPYFCAGEMAERSNAAVLKTVEVKASGGSNPSLSAKQNECPAIAGIFVLQPCQACLSKAEKRK